VGEGEVFGGDGGIGLFRPQDRVRPAVFRLKVEVDFGTGGKGMSLNGLSCGDLQSSRPCVSADEAAVDAALNREELSVVEAVFVLEAPLPLSQSQQFLVQSHKRGMPNLAEWHRQNVYLPIASNVHEHIIVIQVRQWLLCEWCRGCFSQLRSPVEGIAAGAWTLKNLE
jgi:hypothetical protein